MKWVIGAAINNHCRPSSYYIHHNYTTHRINYGEVKMIFDAQVTHDEQLRKYGRLGKNEK